MFNHIMIGSNDIERSKRFYDAVLGVLGAGEPLRNNAGSGHVRLFYRHDGSTFSITEPINGEKASAANGGTIGFKCTSPEQVKAFHDTAVAHGGQSIEGEPGLRDGTMGPLHLAYVRDPTATSFARFIVPSNRPFGARLTSPPADSLQIARPWVH